MLRAIPIVGSPLQQENNNLQESTKGKQHKQNTIQAQQVLDEKTQRNDCDTHNTHYGGSSSVQQKQQQKRDVHARFLTTV